MGVLERIEEIELEMARTQKNKATARHMGELKARLAQLRRELLEPKGGGGGKGEGFDVAKTGDARIGFVGFPSVGKVPWRVARGAWRASCPACASRGRRASASCAAAAQSTLLTNLSGVHSEVAAYEFTTLTTVPGVIHYKGAKIQLLDLPGAPCRPARPAAPQAVG